MWAGIKSKNSGALLLAALFGPLQSFSAHAADGDVTPPPTDPPEAATVGGAAQRQLAPIVITATKRQTTAQSTPISITAVTAADIASRGIPNLSTLARSVPGVAMRDSGPGESEFEMRGLNSEGGSSSVVGFYLDEIPLSSPAFSNFGAIELDTNLYDLARVEVLRGPQGTLYGSSSMGGTIRLIPSPPQLRTFAASAEEKVSDTISGGGINHQENAMINLPLGQTAAVRVVGSFTRDSGWIKRLVLADGSVTTDPGIYPNVSRPDNFYSAPLQEALNGVNTTLIDSVRAQFLWQPTDNLTIEPLVMYQRTEQGAPNEVDVDGMPSHPTTPTVKAHYEIYDTPEPQEGSFSFGSLKIVYQLPSFSVTSATGLWHSNQLIRQDATEEINAVFGIPANDASAGGLGPTGPGYSGPGASEQDTPRQLSEEFRLTSTAPGALQWVVGYFYQDLYSQFNQYIISPEAAPVIGAPPADFIAFMNQVITQNAVFGDISWRLSPRFKVEAGLRHYHYSLSDFETEYGAFAPNAYLGNGVPYSVAFSNSHSGFLPSFTATYNINSDDMIYAKASEGFRIGGANNPAPAADPGTTSNPFPIAVECGLQAKVFLTSTCNPNIYLPTPSTFASDSLWSYELGEKSSFLQHRMIADADLYWESWRNPQVPANIAGFNLTGNAGNARIRGIEGQLQTLLPMGFDLSLNAAYTDAKFLVSNAVAGIPAGAGVPDIPKVTASAILHWNDYLRDDLYIFGSLEEDYVSERANEPVNGAVTPTLQNFEQLLIHVPSYSMVNLRIGLGGTRNGGDKWTATLFVDNLTNNQVLLDPQPQQVIQTPAFTRMTISRPLTAGIDLTYSFH
jgi:iron complex outermembrane recepter protein